MESAKEESIYNLIPIPPKDRERPPRFDSSTIRAVASPPVKKRAAAGMGRAPGAAKPDPKQFTKKHIHDVQLPEPKKFTYCDENKKPAVPKGVTKLPAPVEKNFVKANAIDAILMESKKLDKGPQSAQELNPEYGKVPAYLTGVKKEMEEEFVLAEKMAEEKRKQEEAAKLPPNTRLLEEEERLELLEGLKKRQIELEQAYRTLPLRMDSQVQRNKKSKLEMDLKQVDEDVARLSKKFVYVTL